jgi:cobalt/nickel transport system permease protein
MRSIETSGCLSRWRGHTIETCVLCAGLAGCSLVLPTVLAGSAVAVASTALAAGAEVPLRDYLRKLTAPLAFVGVSALPLCFGVESHPHLAAAWEPMGARSALLAAARSVGTLSATLLLAFTTPFPRLMGVLERLRLPGILLDVLALVHREIFLLDDTSSRLRRSLACRNGWGRGSSGIRTLSLGAAALFVQALRRSERMERGLASRGGMDGRVRHGVSRYEWHPAALLGAVLLPAALAACILWGKARLGL